MTTGTGGRLHFLEVNTITGEGWSSSSSRSSTSSARLSRADDTRRAETAAWFSPGWLRMGDTPDLKVMATGWLVVARATVLATSGEGEVTSIPCMASTRVPTKNPTSASTLKAPCGVPGANRHHAMVRPAVDGERQGGLTKTGGIRGRKIVAHIVDVLLSSCSQGNGSSLANAREYLRPARR
jgi:hypothetical protein